MLGCPLCSTFRFACRTNTLQQHTENIVQMLSRKIIIKKKTKPAFSHYLHTYAHIYRTNNSKKPNEHGGRANLGLGQLKGNLYKQTEQGNHEVPSGLQSQQGWRSSTSLGSSVYSSHEMILPYTMLQYSSTGNLPGEQAWSVLACLCQGCHHTFLSLFWYYIQY